MDVMIDTVLLYYSKNFFGSLAHSITHELCQPFWKNRIAGVWWRNSPKSKIPNSSKCTIPEAIIFGGAYFLQNHDGRRLDATIFGNQQKSKSIRNSLLSLATNQSFESTHYDSFLSLSLETKAALERSIPTLYCCSYIVPIVSIKTGSFQNNEKKIYKKRSVKR